MLALSAAPTLPKESDAALSPARAVTLARADADEIYERDQVRGNKPDAPYMRYFWVSTPKPYRDEFLIAFCAHLNLLSDQGKVRWPVFVAPDVLRIDVRDYGWDRNEKKLRAWEQTRKFDVYFHQQAQVKKAASFSRASPTKQKMVKVDYDAGDVIPLPAVWLDHTNVNAMREVLYTESPILMAEWFFVQSCRQISLRNDEEGTGYYDFLQLKSRDDFFRLTGTDAKVAAKLFRTWRAVVLKSGISEQNRQIIRLGATSGSVWGTLDTFKQKGKGVAERALRDGEFVHDAEEWFGFLPNGLPITFLGDAKGVAQATAPDKIGPDDSKLNKKSRDFRVHANLSCIRCHGHDDMLKPVDDWARKTFKKGGVLSLADPDKTVALELESDYLRDLERLLLKDRADYTDAVRDVTTSKLNPKGLNSTKFAELYANAFTRYTSEDVTVEDQAREIGVTKAKYLAAIRAFGKSRGINDNPLATQLVSEEGMRRLTWEDTYALAMSVTLGLRPPETIDEKKVKPAFPEKEKK